MPRKTFVAGEVLAAADVNTYLMDQAVMTFAGSAARGSAIASPSEGMVSYLEDTDSVEVYDSANWIQVGGSQAGNVVQVVSTTKTDSFSTTSTSFVDITGFSVSITPSSASNKILVLVDLHAGNSSTEFSFFNLVRDSTNISVGTGGTNNVTASVYRGETMTDAIFPVSTQFLDSPSSTSTLTYKVQMKTSGGTALINRRNVNTFAATVSTITVMEIAG